MIPLAERVMAEVCVRCRICRPRIGKRAGQWLKAHDWPWNIAKLRLVIEAALDACSGEESSGEALMTSAGVWRAGAVTGPVMGEAGKLDESERAALVAALKSSEGNRRLVATKVGVSLRTVYNMLERHGLKGRG